MFALSLVLGLLGLAAGFAAVSPLILHNAADAKIYANSTFPNPFQQGNTNIMYKTYPAPAGFEIPAQQTTKDAFHPIPLAAKNASTLRSAATEDGFQRVPLYSENPNGHPVEPVGTQSTLQLTQK